MMRLSGHASANELASLGVGELRPRKAARIESHLAGCHRCTELNLQLSSVSATLATVHYPPMPDQVLVRIEAVLAVEATQRVAALPETEPGRRELPVRQHRRAARPRWQLPGLSVPATRLVSAAAALVVVAAGGYEIAAHTGTAVTGPPSASAAMPAQGQIQKMSLGPSVTYGSAGAQRTITEVQSAADFGQKSLGTQAAAAVHAAAARGASARSNYAQPGVPGVQGSSASGSSATVNGPVSRLAACLNLIAGGRTVLLVDQAHFQHRPATIIVLAATAASPAEAWVVGSSCSASARDVLFHAVVNHL